MIKKLRLKLILASMTSLFIVLFILVGSIGVIGYQNVVSKADSTLQLLSENDGRFPMEMMDNHKPGRQFSAEMPFETRFFSVVIDESGDVCEIDVGRIAAVDSESASQYALQLYENNRTSGFLNDYRYLVTTTDTQTLIIFLDCARDLNSYRSLLFISISASLVGALAVLLLLLVLSKRMTKPFAESYEKQKRFITDAGHELKTPLTIIDADAEVLEMDVGENEWISDIKAQTKRLADMTNQLVTLARMEEENSRNEMIDFPLSDIVQESTDSFQTLAKSRQYHLTSKIEPMITMEGDEKAIRGLVTILLDNAMKYTNENGEIQVSLSQSKNYISLQVFNTCNVMNKEDLPHLFDRFYRTDKSRNSSTGGYGLGLSIAQATVIQHKGKIEATSEDGHSLMIKIRFPK